MASDTRPTKPRVDSDGVRIVETPGVRTSVWLLVLAMALVGIAVFVVVRPAFKQKAVAPAESAARNIASAANDARGARPEHPATRAVPRTPVKPVRAAPATDVNPPAATARDDNPTPAPAEPPAADNPAPEEAAAEDQSGIALFPPPGTDPPKPGIIVPEDFELPPGYVRHYQVTDQGQPLPAILMFHPDYQFVDEHGVPVPVPADRIVPPEMAPAGLSVEMLKVPEDPVPMIEVPKGSGAQDSTP